ncbi:MAG: nucleotidyltransferase family protein [Candidatus Sungbacteria bacterium]|nr:nucleotidyltransferase family protein [Candidatus Sungbacteria bacterium]
MKVIILAGGKGTRLPNSAKDIPKALVKIRGKAMLDHIVEGLEKHGLKDIRLSLGFRADQIIAHLTDNGKGYIEHVVEPEPLGTGGAVKFATSDIGEDFMVLNGDVMNDIDFTSLLKTHKPGMPCIVGAWREDARDFGLLEIKDGRIKAFLEKPAELKPGYINAGCYILHPKHFEGIMEKTFMIEKDVFPRLAESGSLHVFLHNGFWQDAGTEARLEEVRRS